MINEGDHVIFVPEDEIDDDVKSHVNLPAIVMKQRGDMYHLIFPDGFKFYAFIDELIPVGGVWG